MTLAHKNTSRFAPQKLQCFHLKTQEMLKFFYKFLFNKNFPAMPKSCFGNISRL